MTEPEQLPDAVGGEIDAHCARGDELAEAGQYEAAITEYNAGWERIPSPKNNCEASTWVLAAIADAAFLGGLHASAREAIEYAMICPGGLGNPFLHLRYGQILFDAAELPRAADELMRAYMGGGAELFAEEDSKYLHFLRTKAQL
jgi:hypothetical protein